MATQITVPFKQLPKVFQQYGKFVRAGTLPAMRRLAKQASRIITTATKDAPPASANGSRGAVNYGTFISKWRADLVTLNGNQGVLVSNDSGIKGATIEWGGKWPNKGPPVSAIATWATKKLGLSYEEAKKAAFPIAAAIKRRGLRPRLVMTGTETQKSFRMSMESVFYEVVVKACDRLGGVV